MARFGMAVGFGAVMILLVAGRAEAQWRYTDDKGVQKITQYKADIPERYRDAAIWAGPTGVGHPALSEEQRQAKQRDDAYRRIGQSEAELVKYRRAAQEAEQRERANHQRFLDSKREQAEAARQAAEEARQRRTEQLQEESVRLQREQADLQRQQVEIDRQRLYRGR